MKVGVGAGLGVAVGAADKGKGAVEARKNATRPSRDKTLVFIGWGFGGWGGEVREAAFVAASFSSVGPTPTEKKARCSTFFES
jgi:hypothetical protein